MSISAASSFRGTQSAYIGLRFPNEITGATNNGYIRLTTTAPTGYPATIVGCSYENTGAGIVIVDPDTIFYDYFE